MEAMSAVLHLGMSRIRAGVRVSDGSTVRLSLHLSSVQLLTGPPRLHHAEPLRSTRWPPAGTECWWGSRPRIRIS